LIWCPVSCLDHFPPVLQKLSVAPSQSWMRPKKALCLGLRLRKISRMPNLNVEPTSSGLSWHPPLELFLPLNFLLLYLNDKYTNSGYSED
jgi:hypothetical protein